MVEHWWYVTDWRAASQGRTLMPQYKAPGVYVEEVERGPKPIEGVGTSTAGFLGETERGPEDPKLLTSYADYQRHFGGVIENRYLAQSVDGFFQNGGSTCYVGRVTAAETNATGNLSSHSPSAGTLEASESTLHFGRIVQGTERTRTVAVRNLGERGDPPIKITGHSDLSNGFEKVTEDPPSEGITLNAGETEAIEVEFAPADDQTGEITATLQIQHDSGPALNVDLEGVAVGVNDGVLGTSTGHLDFGSVSMGDAPSKTLTITNLGSTPVNLTNASTDGSASGDFRVEHDFDEDGNITISGEESARVEVICDPSGVGEGKEAELRLEHDASNTTSPLTIDLEADVTESIIQLEAVGPGDWGEGIAVTVEDGSLFEPSENQLFQVTVRCWGDLTERQMAKKVYDDPGIDNDDAPDPDVEEVYDNLSTEEASSDYYGKQLDGNSTVIGVDEEGSQSGQRPANGTIWFSGEFSGDPVKAEHFEGKTGDTPDEQTGLEAFKKVDEIAMVCVPDEHEYSLAQTIVDHCTNQKDRFAILQSAEQAGGPGDLEPSVRSDFAAFYYPWLTIGHLETGRDQEIPPGGHVAGIYARSDQEHGVHKAPANEQVRGIRELQLNISKGDQEILNPRGVNCIRTFRGRGTRVWGARTTSSDPSWKYVNVRRLFLFVEESIDEGTQWVVFEPNDENLWARVRQTIRNFLTSVWQDGALMGTTPEEAFYVKCDRSTMTQNDIDNGRLICEIGIAPVKPAEFVVFRISQTTAGAEG